MKKAVLLCSLLFLLSCYKEHKIREINDFSKLIGKAPVKGGLRIPGYWTWCGSCIKGEDGKYHLFASRWLKKYPFMEGYPFYSEIIHAVSNTPEGPYVFKNVALPERGENFWDGRMTHNPSVIKYGNIYYMFYIGSTYSGEGPTTDSLKNVKNIFKTPAYRNIRIGIAKTNSLNGNWERLDKPILSPQPNGFDSVIVTNPAPCVGDSGEIYLVYRTFIRGTGQRLGVARAVHPDSTFSRMIQKPISSVTVEDPFIWRMNGMFYIIAKDMTGDITGEKLAGVFMKTKDITHWKQANYVKAYSRKIVWDNNVTTIQGSFERPNILFENGMPAYLFAATADGPGDFWNAANTWTMVIPLKYTK
jgi:hypothetical protein